MPGIMNERRHSERRPLILAVEVIEVHSGTKLSARTGDVNRTGCYIDTLNPTPEGTLVRVRLTREGEVLELPGKVIYVSPRLGMGIRFDQNCPPAQLVVLNRWLGD